MKKILILTLGALIAAGANAATTTINGKSVSAGYSRTSVSNATSPKTGATYKITTNSLGQATGIAVKSASGSQASFNATSSTYILGGGSVYAYRSSNGLQNALAVNPSYFGWSYQSFGVWNNASSNGSGTVSAGTFGNVITSGASIPKTGSATFYGVAGGMAAVGSNNAFYVTADMMATTNFATRSILFSTYNSAASSTPGGFYSYVSGLNLSGTLTYASNTNSFSGTVSNAGGGGIPATSGTASGQFYGPSAQEIGGVFALKTGNAGYIGGFGGKR
jgi:hypothetical protein